MSAAVRLIKALGGDWDVAQLPSGDALANGAGPEKTR
jgi:hypothetical protein